MRPKSIPRTAMTIPHPNIEVPLMEAPKILYTVLSAGILSSASLASASEAELKIPALNTVYNIFGASIRGTSILGWGMVIAVLGMLFGLMEFLKIKKLPAHKSMLEVSALIYETCKTYLFQQGKFLAILEVLIGGSIFYYFFV